MNIDDEEEEEEAAKTGKPVLAIADNYPHIFTCRRTPPYSNAPGGIRKVC